MDGKKSAVLLAILAGSMWGSIGLFVNVLGTFGIGSIELTVGRFIIAALVVGLWLLMKKRELLRIRLRDLPVFFFCGVCCLLFFNLCYGIAIERSSMAVAAVLLYTSPMIVMAISAVFFGERLTLIKGAAVIMAVTGCAFVSGIMTGILSFPVSAYLWGCGAALGYALYSVTAGRLLKRYDSLTVLFYAFFAASVAGCFLADIPYVLDKVTERPGAGAWLLAAALVCNVFSYLSYNLALNHIEPSRAAVAAAVEPAVASLLGVLVFKETMDGYGVMGVICILCAIFLLNKPGRAKP